MQVTDVTANTKSATVGYLEVESMGIADSPEFMMILASSLYQYADLAFICEAITNATDAHIDADIVDTSIYVELSEDSVTIKDFVDCVIDKWKSLKPKYMYYYANRINTSHCKHFTLRALFRYLSTEYPELLPFKVKADTYNMPEDVSTFINACSNITRSTFQYATEEDMKALEAMREEQETPKVAARKAIISFMEKANKFVDAGLFNVLTFPRLNRESDSDKLSDIELSIVKLIIKEIKGIKL